jgi:hypothetical protein
MHTEICWKCLGKQPLGRPKRRREVNNQMGVREIGCQKVVRTGCRLFPVLESLKFYLLVLEK